MSQNRILLIGAFVAAVVVALGGFFLGVQPQLAAASASDDQRVATEQRNDTARAELAKLREENKTLDAQKQALAGLQASVPSTASTSTFYRELDDIAASTGVTISSITTSDPAAYTNPSGDKATTTTEATAAPMPASDPAITGADFSLVPVTVGVNGSYEQARAFLKGVQTGPRLFLVTNITSSAGGTGDSTEDSTWTFGGSVYVLTEAKAASAADSGTTPAKG
jgi:Tfp pilus assembly protein PilO